MMDFVFNNLGKIFVLFFVAIVAARLYGLFRRKDKLRKMAEQLELHFSERPLDEHAESQLASMKDRAWVPLFQKLISIFRPWEIKGRFRGMQAQIYTRYREEYRGRRRGFGSRVKEAFMRTEICFSTNLDLGLQIFSENPFVRGGYDAHDDRRNEIQSGNQELDRKVTINGISEVRIVRLLARSDLLEALIHLFEEYSNAVVDDESVRLEERRFLLDADACRTRLEDLFQVASCIDRAIRFV